jgi:dTDP-4-amino-4,6-dideoxygalactose transaminase
MLVTDDKELYRRVVRWGQYERIVRNFSPDETAATKNLPFGGVKNRLNQCSAAIGIEQLKKYDAEREEIEKAMLYYFKGIEDVKGIKRVYPKWERSNKAGWYASCSIYSPEAFGGLTNTTFARALNAEVGCSKFGSRCNFPLHTSSIFDSADIFANSRPPASRFLPPGVSPKTLTGRLPVAEAVNDRVIVDPWFKHFDRPKIDRFIEAVHKVAANAAALRDWELKQKKA